MRKTLQAGSPSPEVQARRQCGTREGGLQPSHYPLKPPGATVTHITMSSHQAEAITENGVRGRPKCYLKMQSDCEGPHPRGNPETVKSNVSSVRVPQPDNRKVEGGAQGPQAANTHVPICGQRAPQACQHGVIREGEQTGLWAPGQGTKKHMVN